jgi:8-oxo-dGTP diphosphatase
LVDTVIPVVVALIVRDGAVLMCQRPKDKIYGLKWEFPGGKVEPGETNAHALARELQEELGIDAQIGEKYFNEIASYSNGMTYDISYYMVRVFSPEPVNKEFHDIRWVRNDMMPMLEHLSGNDCILKQFSELGIPE